MMDRIEEANRKGPHLIETTMSGYEQRTYMVGLDSDSVKKISKDFERLRDMDLPDEAMAIVKQWTWRNEDDCE